MGLIVTNLENRVKSLANSLREHPLESALCVTYFLIWVLRATIGNALKSSGMDVDVEQFFVWFVPHFFLCYFLHQFKDRHNLFGIIYYISWFAWVPLLIWCSEPDSWSVGTAYLLAGVALIIGTKKMDNDSFGQYIVSVAIRLAEGVAVGLLLWLVFLAIYESVTFLFSLALPEECFEYPSVFIWMVITPLICLSLLNGASELEKGEKLLRIMVDVVLSTALVIYAAILYAYIIRILSSWELPKGGVAYTVLGFLCVSLACYLLRLQVEKRHYEWFYKAFPSLALAPLVLLWIGVFRRIGEYGLTEARVYLLVVSALMTLFVGMLFSERSRRFQLMALILAASAFLFTYVPGIRAKDFGRRSQQARSEERISEVKDEVPFQKDTTNTSDDVSLSTPWLSLGDKDNRVWNLKDCSKEIDLGPYTQLVQDFIKQEDSMGLAFCNESNPADTLLYCPIRERIAKADENTPPEEILLYENGRYKAIFWEFSIHEAKPDRVLAITKCVLFKTPEK